MKPGQISDAQFPAVGLIEEAVHLLRTAPIPTLACWLIGALPFLLGFLYFWADMGRSASATDRLAGGSIGLAIGFVWMKFWHALFAMRLRSQAACEQYEVPRMKQCLSILYIQTVIQPLGLFLMPLAAIAVLPFPWVCSFFQSATAASTPDKGVRKTLLTAWTLSNAGLTQNLRLVLLMSAFGLFVFLNWLSVCLLFPELVRMLAGVETRFGMNMFAMLNSTFLAIVCALTYMSVDPILKAVYVLRCFRAECVHSGEDITADLRRLRVSAQAVNAGLATLLMAGCMFLTETCARAEDAAVFQPQAAQVRAEPLNSEKLGSAINDVLSQPKYQWRGPRERKAIEVEDNVVLRFLRDAAMTVRKFFSRIGEWIEDLLDRLWPKRKSADGSSWKWMVSTQILLWILLAAAAIVLALVLLRWNRARRSSGIEAAPIRPLPNLNDENLGADQMPEDGWTRLGRELLAKGEFRLALRAFYLASLALLAERQLITLAKFKSNREYERELRRKGHDQPSLLDVFSGNVSIFERAWYGSLELAESDVRQFADAVEKMRSAA